MLIEPHCRPSPSRIKSRVPPGHAPHAQYSSVSTGAARWEDDHCARVERPSPRGAGPPHRRHRVVWVDVRVGRTARGARAAPLAGGDHVNYRPPAWDRRRRPGAMSASATSRYIVIEGCGAIRRTLAPLLDVRVWVQSDYDEAERRGILRDGGTDTAAAFWREWEAQEVPFFAQDQPWERADLFARGTPPPDSHLVMCSRPQPDSQSNRYPSAPFRQPIAPGARPRTTPADEHRPA